MAAGTIEKSRERGNVKTAQVLRLVRAVKSEDTIKRLRDLLSDALHGEIVGIAYVAVERGGEFGVGYTGAVRESARSASDARGMLRSLDDHLGKLVDGERP